MTKDKYDFIQDVLNNKRLNEVQRERIFKLTTDEIKRDKTLNLVLEERVLRLENSIGLNSELVLPDNLDSKNSKIELNLDEIEFNSDEAEEFIEINDISINPSLPKTYYNPKYLYNYLLTFNQDPILKSTCHLVDSNELEKINEYCKTDNYDFEIHLVKINEAFNKINKIFAPPFIKPLIRGYLTGKNFDGVEIHGWSENKIIWNWSHQSISIWAKENSGIPPNPDVGLSEKYENMGFEFEKPLKLKNEHLQTMGDLVIYFKKMFHIREDNSLFKIIEKQNIFKNWNEKINFELNGLKNAENIEFFTDIDKLLQSYNEIIQLIIDFGKEKKPKVCLNLFETDFSIYFSILSSNGVYGKSLSSAKNRLIGGKYEAIIKKLNGLCNIYLQADFGNNAHYRLTIWDDEFNNQNKREEVHCRNEFKSGVEHILEFKRK